MFIYSQNIKAFINRSNEMLTEIMNKNGFLRYGSVEIVVFEDPTKLGYYKRIDSRNHVIGLNKKLMFEARPCVVKDILGHEVAHHQAVNRRDEHTHGKFFREICKEIGCSPIAVEGIEQVGEKYEGDIQHQRLVERVKKLFRLASSSNKHEAELAAVKANELLLKYNLQHLEDNNDDIYMSRVISTKRMVMKYKVISWVLNTFNIYMVRNQTIKRGEIVLEISGDKASVEIGEYVAQFLDEELERLWKVAQKEDGLRGKREKNSFFYGVYQGYMSKMEVAKEQTETVSDSLALALYDDKIKKMAKELVYGDTKLTSTRSSSFSVDPFASGVGQQAGKRLSINPGMSNEGGKTLLLG